MTKEKLVRNLKNNELVRNLKIKAKVYHLVLSKVQYMTTQKSLCKQTGIDLLKKYNSSRLPQNQYSHIH